MKHAEKCKENYCSLICSQNLHRNFCLIINNTRRKKCNTYHCHCCIEKKIVYNRFVRSLLQIIRNIRYNVGCTYISSSGIRLMKMDHFPGHLQDFSGILSVPMSGRCLYLESQRAEENEENQERQSGRVTSNWVVVALKFKIRLRRYNGAISDLKPDRHHHNHHHHRPHHCHTRSQSRN